MGLTLYSLPYTSWPEAPDQSDAIQLFAGDGFFDHITSISYHYRSVYTNANSVTSLKLKAEFDKRDRESLIEVHPCLPCLRV